MKAIELSLLLGAASLLLSACGPQTDCGPRVINVGAYEVEAAQTAYTRNYLGQISSGRLQVMFSLHDGTVTSIKVRPGQKVREGQVIAEISAPNVKSMYRANQATLRQARDGYKRAKKVYEKGGLTEVKWMEIQTKLEQAEAAAEISQKSLDDCTLKAPFSGTVTEVMVSAGEKVSVASQIAGIIDETHLDVTIAVPEDEYSSIHEGSKAKVVVTALDDIEIPATVSEIGVNSTTLTHSYKTRLDLKSHPENLKSGMACKVYMECNLMERYVIPANVVKTDDNGRYVWIVNCADSTVHKRRVEVRDFVQNGVAVSKGLQEGDLIVSEGISKISTGMKVNATVKNVL